MNFTKPNGEGGGAFSSATGNRVKEVRLSTYRHPNGNTFVESIQLVFADGTQTKRHGGNPNGSLGDRVTFHVDEGDCIVGADVRSGWGTDAVRFKTKNGVVSPWFGGTGGTTASYSAGPKQELVGMHGRCGWLLDNVRFDWGGEGASDDDNDVAGASDVTLPPWSSKLYSHSYWKNGWRKSGGDRSKDILCFETGHFGLAIQMDDLTRVKYGRFDNDDDDNSIGYVDALSEAARARMDALDEEELFVILSVKGSSYRLSSCLAGTDRSESHLSHAKLWEVGKVAQHYELEGLVFKNEDSGDILDGCVGALDVWIWPDSFTLNVHLSRGEISLEGASIEIRLMQWRNLSKIEGDCTDGSKIGRLTCDVFRPSEVRSKVKVEVAVNDQTSSALWDENDSCHRSKLHSIPRTFQGGWRDIRDYDDFTVEVTNQHKDEPMYVPFQLFLEHVANITGLCPFLCSMDGAPTGIPVQLSKNWHHGIYVRAFALIPAPPGKTVYKLRIAYGFYGTLPSASHANLSLIGYRRGNGAYANSRWEQMAIGCWGETTCLDMDMGLRPQTITDVRTLFCRNGRDGQKWRFSDGGWGGDWLNVMDDSARKMFPKELKTAYVSHGPCLTEVHYSGAYGEDSSVPFYAKVQTLRTDDYVRTFYRLDYRFREAVSALNAYFFKMGTTGSLVTPKVAYGDGNGLVEELEVPNGLRVGQFFIEKRDLRSGASPFWIAFPGAFFNGGNPMGNGWRALVIRSYEASIGSDVFSAPTASFPVSGGDGEGRPYLDFLLTPPEGITTFNVGDTVEMELEWIILPRVADDYYGPNKIFRQHLEKHPSSWETVFREAYGNNLKVEVDGGEMKNRYPLVIGITGREVTIAITGGIGAVPVTFSGLDSPDYQLLQVTSEAERAMLDQSVHDGNDFWQTDYDPSTFSFSQTFNLPLDGVNTSKWVLTR